MVTAQGHRSDLTSVHAEQKLNALEKAGISHSQATAQGARTDITSLHDPTKSEALEQPQIILG